MAIFLKLVILTLSIQMIHIADSKKQSNTSSTRSKTNTAIMKTSSPYPKTIAVGTTKTTIQIATTNTNSVPVHTSSATSAVKTTSPAPPLPVPNCKNLQYSSSNNSINVNLNQKTTSMITGFDFLLYNTEGKTVKNVTNNTIFKVTDLPAGTNFSLDLTAVGIDKRSSDSCTKQVFTSPPDPRCEEVIYTSENSSISMNFSQILTDGVHGFNVVIMDKHSLDDTIIYNKTEVTNVHLHNLNPGGEYQIQVIALGRANLKSGTCTRKVFTKPADPRCEDITYNSENEYISMNFSQTLTANIHGYDVILYKKNDKVVFHNKTDVRDVKFNNLEPGQKFKVEIKAVGRGRLRSGACTKNVYTRPPDPRCEEAIYTSENSSISMNFSQILTDGVHGFNVVIMDKHSLDDTIIYNKTEVTNVHLHNLNPGGEYQIQVEALGSGNLKSGTCTRKVYTRPPDPNCEDVSFKAESTLITMNLTPILTDGVHGYNVVLLGGKNKSISVNISKSFNVQFDNLQSGREFQVKIQAVGRGNLRSDTCTKRVFTRPPGPANCGSNFSANDIMATQMNLTLPFSKTFDYLLRFGERQAYIPKATNYFNLKDLKPDTLYNLTLQQVFRSEDGQIITSTNYCNLTKWTRPSLICSNITWLNMFTGQQAVPPRNSNYKSAVFASYDQYGQNSSVTEPYDQYLSHDFIMERGTSYTIVIYFIGHGGLTSEPKCHNANVIRPVLAPGCSNAIDQQNATCIVIDPKNLNKSGTGAQLFRLEMRPIVIKSLGDLDKVSFSGPPIVYKNLPPGTEFKFEFKSIGKRGTVSSFPCTVKGHTRPTDPNCSILTYSARNDSIQTYLRGNISYGAQSYNIVVMQGSSVIQNVSSVLDVRLTGLQAGESYNLVVTAVGLANMESRNSCHKTIYTRPNKPLCDSLLINNFTTSSAAWTSREPSPIGVTKYIVLLKTDSEKEINKTLELTGSISFTNLQHGYRYQSVIFSVSKYGMISEENCTYSFYTEPSAVETVNISLSATSFYAIWNKPVGIVDFYFVDTKCQCSSACTFQPRKDNITETQIDIPGLVPGTMCNLTIVAYSGNMKSIPKYVYNIYTNETVPDVVQNVTIHRNSSHIQVFWEQPSKPNGKIQSYTVYLFGTNNNRSIVKHSNQSTAAGFESLIPGTCYTVKVTAGNNAGEGNPVSFNIYTDEEKPGQVEQISGSNISSTAISIGWTKPDRPNGIIINYSIQILEAGKCIQLVLLNCSICKNTCSNDNEKEVKESAMDIETGNSLGCTFQTTLDFNQTETVFRQNVTNLSPFTNYSVSVYAFTSKGKGDVSQIYQNTSEDHPGQVVNMSLASESKAVKVSFKPPSNPNGIILQYEIKYVPITTKPKNCYSDDKYSGEYDGIINGTFQTNTTEEQNGKELVFTIDNLHSYWTYNISVRAKTSVGFGNFCDFVSERTKPDKPGPIRALSFTDVTNRNIALSWKEPCFTNGIISQYKVFVLSGNSTKTSLKSTGSSIVIPQLLPYTNYNMTVFGVTSGESGGIGLQGVSTGMKRTLCEEPKEPTNLTIVSNTSNSIAVRWKQPVMKTCATEYEVKATDARESSIIRTCTTIGFNNVTCNITGLDEYWNYTLTLTAFTTYRNSSRSWNGTLLSRTCQAPPGPVTKVTVETEKNVTKPRTITVRWNLPVLRNRNGIIKSFTILYGLTDGATKMQNVSFKSTLSTYKLTITDAPGNYNIRVFATNIYDAKKDDYFNTTNIKLSPGAPPLPKTSVAPLIQVASQVTVSNDEKQFPLSISMDILCNDKYGKITERGVIVSDASKIGGSDRLFRGARSDFLKRKTSIYSTWQSVHDMDNMPPYIATDDLKVTCSSGRTKRSASSSPSYNYVIGSDGECESGQKYCNGYLKPGKSYKARVYVCTDEGCTETNYLSQFKTEPNLVPVIAGGATGGIVAAAVVIIIVIIVIRIRRKRAKDGESTGDGETNFGFDGEMKNLKKGSKTSIQKSQFARKVEDLHADSNLIFAKEYKVIKENSPSHATEAAEQQSTRNKNRYTNILAYDHSRVKLLPTEDEEGSDYINANYIPGFNSQREYIATQGPQNCTKDDFWRMIWEQNVNVIVMLTQLIERGRRKCDQYWPNNTREPVFFGDLIVEMESESPMNDYILRVFSLKLGKNVKNVKHFQFLAWPDMGIPQTTECMLYFVRGVRDHTPAQRRGPIVVHCSAGVGRTGTFIAVDHLMQHVRTHDHLDIFNLVLAMRDNRTNMVQTEDQYIFIHDCIKDYIEELEHEDEDAEDGNVIEEPAYANAAIYANRS